jgi:mono-ADP-ribosyltransferase sirtuin 6
MAMATMVHQGICKHVITTNLDGLHRKSGLQTPNELTHLHGCCYTERCTSCQKEFVRNYHVRHASHVHDHAVDSCEVCGSTDKKGGRLPVNGKNRGTKDTHINFGENLDDRDWNAAELHCEKADLCIVAGTSMSLRHITHFPFMAKKTVIINLQKTPDDEKADLRIFGGCDEVFSALMKELGMEIEPMKPWYPQHAKPLDKLPRWLDPMYKESAIRLHQTMKKLENQSEMKVEEKKSPSEKMNDRSATSKTKSVKMSSSSEKSSSGFKPLSLCMKSSSSVQDKATSNSNISEMNQVKKSIQLLQDLASKQQVAMKNKNNLSIQVDLGGKQQQLGMSVRPSVFAGFRPVDVKVVPNLSDAKVFPQVKHNISSSSSQDVSGKQQPQLIGAQQQMRSVLSTFRTMDGQSFPQFKQSVSLKQQL